MKNEKKCNACGKWTDGTLKHCAFCGSTIDPLLIAKEQREKRERLKKQQALENENRFERYLRKLQESEKP